MKCACVCRWLAVIAFCVISAGEIGCGTKERVDSISGKTPDNQASAEARFNTLYAELRQFQQRPEVWISDTPREMNDCDAFRQIVAGGEVSMPFIVREMERGDFYLFQAMQEITGMDVCDYYSEYPESLQGISALWIKWWQEVGSKTPGQRKFWQRVAAGSSEPKLSFDELRALLVKHGVEVSHTTNTPDWGDSWNVDEIACAHTGFNTRIQLKYIRFKTQAGKIEPYSTVEVPNTLTGRRFLQLITKDVSPVLAQWVETIPDADAPAAHDIHGRRDGNLWIISLYRGSNLEFRCVQEGPMARPRVAARGRTSISD